MRFIYFLLLFVCLSLSVTSCYTLSIHQTGKTLGKNGASFQIIGGVSDFPTLKDENNIGESTFIFPRAVVVIGVTENIDVGTTVGAGQIGLISKFQFIGNKDSRFAISSGVNLNIYSDAFLFGGKEMRFLELPLYLSYDLTSQLTFYTIPVLSYLKGRDFGTLIYHYEDKFEYFTKGWVNGWMVKLPNHLNLSLEVAWQSELYSNKYTFTSTLGLSFILDFDDF